MNMRKVETAVAVWALFVGGYILLDINLRNRKLPRRAEFSFVPCWLLHVVSEAGKKENPQEGKSHETPTGSHEYPESFVCSKQPI